MVIFFCFSNKFPDFTINTCDKDPGLFVKFISE